MRLFQTLKSSAVCAALLLFSFLSSAGSANAQGAPDPLKMDFTPNSIYWNLYVGIEQNYFKEEGFAPEFVPSQNSPQTIQMLVSRGIQVASSQAETMIAAIQSGAKELGIIGTPANRPDWILVASKDVKTWADLKGKNVGFSALKVGEFWLTVDAMQKHGLELADYKRVQIGPTPAKLAALENGSISAAVLFQPAAELALERGYTQLLRFSDAAGDYPGVVYVVSRSWAAEKQHGVRFMRALRKANEFIYDPKNHDAAIAILAKYTKRDAPLLNKIYKQYIVDRVYARDGAVDLAGLETVVRLMKANGEIQASPNVKDFLISTNDGGSAK